LLPLVVARYRQAAGAGTVYAKQTGWRLGT